MARVSVLFSLALLQGVSAAPTGGRTLEPEPVDDTERVNRETGRQVATDDYSGDHGFDTRWDTTEDTVLLRTIMRAAVGGIADGTGGEGEDEEAEAGDAEGGLDVERGLVAPALVQEVELYPKEHG